MNHKQRTQTNSYVAINKANAWHKMPAQLRKTWFKKDNDLEDDSAQINSIIAGSSTNDNHSSVLDQDTPSSLHVSLERSPSFPTGSPVQDIFPC